MKTRLEKTLAVLLPLAVMAAVLALSACNLPLGGAPRPTGTTEPGPPLRVESPTPMVTEAPPVVTEAPPAGPAYPVLPSGWIGREVPPNPPGYPRYAAWLMAPDYNDYAYEFRLTEDGSQGMILFQRFARRNPDGKAFFIVIDGREFPAMPAGKTFISDCIVDGVYRDDIIVIGASDPASPTTIIVDQAWQADRASGRIIDLGSGLNCTIELMGG